MKPAILMSAACTTKIVTLRTRKKMPRLFTLRHRPAPLLLSQLTLTCSRCLIFSKRKRHHARTSW